MNVCFRLIVELTEKLTEKKLNKITHNIWKFKKKTRNE